MLQLPSTLWKDKLECYQVLNENVALIKSCFRFYLLHGIYKKDKRNFGVNSTQFHSFCR